MNASPPPLTMTEVLSTVVDQVARQVARSTIVTARAARPAVVASNTPPVVPLRRRPSLTFATITEEQWLGLRLAIHESGHAVACALLGGEIRASILGDGKTFGQVGKTVHKTVPTGAWASILYAGPWAEARFLARGRPSARQLRSVMDDTGHLDRDALCAHAATAVDVCGDSSDEARLTVPTLLDRAWPSVVAVAQTIHRRGEARHDDVLAALGVTDGGGPGSSQLASIRAGLRSVPPIAREARVHA